MSNSYVVAYRVNVDLKEISVTARDPERGNCKVINNEGFYKLHWNWLRLNAPDKPWLNDWEIVSTGLTREEARLIKVSIISFFTGMGYKVRTVKHYENQ